MDSDTLLLVPLLPLAGFLINALLGRRLKEPIPGVIACLAVAASFLLSIAALSAPDGSHRYFAWIDTGELSIDFAFRLDALSKLMLLVVTGVGLLIHIYSIGYMRGDPGFARYFAYLNLFTFSMLILVLASNLPLLFVGWEGVGLCSYLLIGFWYKDLARANAGIKAFVVNRIGDLGFLLGMFGLFAIFGTFEISEMSWRVIAVSPLLLTVPCFLLFLGACGKSAQIPLYVWLPDAMAGPTPVSALIHAATMVTAGVYMICRLHFVFSAAPDVMPWIAIVAALTSLMAGVMAVPEFNIKKILAYSTISQLSFMFAGAAALGFDAGMFHVTTHAFFKALLFLGAGAVIHALGNEEDIRKMGGLRKAMPLAYACFIVGGLCLAGFPGTSGFFSKESILAACFDRGWNAIGGLLLISAVITGFYTFRMILLAFHGEPHGEHHPHRTPGSMAGPLAILMLLSLGGGALNWILPAFLQSSLRLPVHAAPGSVPHGVILALGVGTSILGIGAALFAYQWKRGWFDESLARSPTLLQFRRLAANKFYVDEIYDYTVVLPLQMTAFACWLLVDRWLIDGLMIDRASSAVYAGAGRVRVLQAGAAGIAAAVLAGGALLFLSWMVSRV
jgi:NADH-quinone oxidoreductase subunit L